MPTTLEGEGRGYRLLQKMMDDCFDVDRCQTTEKGQKTKQNKGNSKLRVCFSLFAEKIKIFWALYETEKLKCLKMKERLLTVDHIVKRAFCRGIERGMYTLQKG